VGCHLGGGESQDALAGADEVLMGFGGGGEAEDAALAEPLGGGHGGEVDGAVLVTVLINTTGVPKYRMAAVGPKSRADLVREALDSAGRR